MARPKPKGPDTLERWSGEGTVAHRGLLLWAMQRPAERSLRAIARATGRGETTARKWCARYRWEERAAAPNSEETAVSLYRRDYVRRWGKADIHHIASRCSYPVSATADAPPASEAEEAILKSRSNQDVTKALQNQRAAEAAEAEVRRRRTEQDTSLRREELLVDLGLAYISKEISKEKSRIRPSLRDIPALIEAKQALRQARSNLSQPVGESKEGKGVQLTESARVRHAKNSGGSVLAAMLEDTLEMQTILGALLAKEERAAEEAGREPKESG